MKNKFLLTLLAIILLPCMAVGQTYSALWKQEKAATDKDQPRSALKVLDQIAQKAESERAYGHLLKATMMSVQMWQSISEDSIKPAIERIVAKEKRIKGDIPLRAVYDAAISRLYNSYDEYLDNSREIAKQYAEQAMERPDKLASTKATGYEPFVVEGVNSSSLFNDDLLSVIGYETKQFDKLHAFYSSANNRRAACIVAIEILKQHDLPTESVELKKSPAIQALDSLAAEYQDLDVAGEVAVERYNLMDYCEGVTVEDRIEYIHYALDKWGSWQRMGELRNEEKDLTTPQFSVRMQKGLVPSNTPQKVELKEVRNINTLTMRVYKTPLDGDTELIPQQAQDYKKLKPQLTLLPEETVTRTYTGQPDYQVINDSMTLAGLPVGVYMLEFEASPTMEIQRGLYRVSDVFTISQPLPDKKTRYAVVNATTGQPIKGAKLRLTTQKYGQNESKQSVTLTTDDKGEVTYKNPDDIGRLTVYAYTDTDRASYEDGVRFAFYYNDSKNTRERTSIFTDRAIYRPGQTVHAAAIVYTCSDGINFKATEGKQVKMVLRDANYKTVEEKALTTDRYGKCSIDLTLPSGKLTGRYYLQINNGSTNFRVEEYKRPTFKVEFPDISEKYTNGDTLLVKAKAVSYAGIPVQGAKVKYTVRRTPSLWWMCSPWYCGTQKMGSEDLKTATTTTDAEGCFIVEMPMVLPEGAMRERSFYNFIATADVTDAAGETHSGECSVPLGSHPTSFTSSLTPQMLSDSLNSVTFNLRNAAGHDVKTTVRFRFDDKGKWLTANTTEPYALSERMTSGKHSLTAICENDTLKQDFIAFGLNDTTLCTKTDDWFYVSSTSFPSDGSPVTMQIGSSLDNVHVLYSVYSGNKVIVSGTHDTSNSLKNMKLYYKEEYGDGLLFTCAWVKNGVCYSHETTIKRPLPDKNLKLQWTTFRDRLTPGQKEEWTLKITKPDGTAADASLVATLYDSSLDQLTKHKWNLSPTPWLHNPTTAWQYINLHGMYESSYLSHTRLQSKYLDLSRFDNDLFNAYAYGHIMHALEEIAMPTGRVMKNRAVTMARSLDVDGVAESKVFNAVDVRGNADDTSTDEQTTTTTDQVRENLNETAFFYPSLQTDGEGNVTMKFTLPESLTTWRFMGIANSTDMMYGSITGETVAQKPVMVQPNVPRFVRTGDKATITTRIANTTAATVNGTVKLTLIDPETEQTVFTQEQTFITEAAKTAAATFQYTPDGQHSLLVCKVTASGKNFSDGEQHYLPILPDRERVTVTRPFTQNEAETKFIDVSAMFPKGVKAEKLTVEYTNNPAWLVVQSLPYVASSNDDNAISQATAVYANTVGRSIANSSPKIKQVFNQWKQEQSNGTSLSSALISNEELKDIALDETPWVADADKETEQKLRMVDFFDDNTIQNRITSATDKLQKLQNADGSWSWWKGMDGSAYMTVEVAEMLARMYKLTGEQGETKSMFNKAMVFLDKKMTKQVEEMKSEERKGHPQSFPGMVALEYLYINSINSRQPSTADARSAQTYLISLLKKETKNQTIYEKALSAIVFAANNETSYSKDYAKSLKEYLVETEEMGCYYDTHKASYSWYDYKIPSHVAALEAIETLTPEDTKTAEGMRRWLLQEKRTQAWDTPINTTNAVYAFLKYNVKQLDSQEQTVLALDGKTIETSKATAGIGYVKAAITNPTAKTFTARKSSDGTSWGAVYAQFMQKTSDIASSNSAISVKREIVSDKKELSVGDRITVKITVEAKRDLDFVQIVDRRAACMEPVRQLSGYRNGAYCSPKDNTTNYYINQMAKGRKVVLETEYYIDRAGEYETGTCTAGCAYAPEYRATAKSATLKIK